MENFAITNLEVFIRLLLAIILGGALGIERSMAGKTAGMRTYSIVSMGAAMFVIISNIISLQYVNFNFDPLRMASQVIVGIGFIGAGLIIFREEKISGLTTAAGLWVSAGIGMAPVLAYISWQSLPRLLPCLYLLFFGLLKKRFKNL